MKYVKRVLSGILLLGGKEAFSQFGAWVDGQVSTEICYWLQPRATLLRDTIYLDGGSIWWTPKLETGSFGSVTNGNNGNGIILTYNLSESFGSDTNTTGLLLKTPLYKAPAGDGFSSALVPQFYDGALLANDASFFLYGGAMFKLDALYDPPATDEIMGYQAYAYGLEKPSFTKSFDEPKLDNNVTRYIAYGGAASAPSENKAWYFSGLVATDRGPIYYNSLKESATDISATLISLDMSVQYEETWNNNSLPENIKGRANPQVTWIPAGEQGLLVVLGGVTYPEWAGEAGTHKSGNESASKEDSPEFMRVIDVYDIANDAWYRQPTVDGPGTRTRGCAVVAVASDGSSFNIYYYGGYDGLTPQGPFHDDVWVLSVPSFQWIQINQGNEIHARAGHQCFKTYPDQMMVLGGTPAQPGSPPACLESGPVLNFNLSSGEWLQSYDPSHHDDYAVPDKVQAMIGGNGAGGATLTTPAPSGWATRGLSSAFATKYDFNKITTYWPYPATASTSRSGAKGSGNKIGKSGLPSWMAPVLGVVLGLVLLTGIGVLFFLWRRQKLFFKRHPSDHGSEEAGSRIMTWIRGQPVEKTLTMTTSDDILASSNGVSTVISNPSNFLAEPSPSPYEVADNQVWELHDTSPRAELHDTGLSPVEVITRHSRFELNGRQLSTDFSIGSFSTDTRCLSSTTPDSPTTGMDALYRGSEPVHVLSYGAEPVARYRVDSDISNMSGTEAKHLRQVSNSSTSSLGGGDRPPRLEQPVMLTRVTSELFGQPTTPCSPPTAMEPYGEGFMDASLVSPILKKGADIESVDDRNQR